MCGIIGIASTVPIVNRGWLIDGRDAMSHRGPDDSGDWWSADGCVGLGHRRLAIIDLSPLAHQPMADAIGELRIVFNGEIYNFADLRLELITKGHGFRSGSDTEVILAAYREWGTNCLSRFNGMFAFALYDSRRNELFMARDRAGEKPLFYSLTSGAVRFASELKGLLADPSLPRRIDGEALDCYLAMGFIPGHRCILQGVTKLPPAHAMIFNLKTAEARLWRYWQLPELGSPDRLPAASEAELLNDLEYILEDAVRRQLVADVSVGVLLSGGVDSSLVTAMAVRAAPRVKTFTMRFPGYGRYDETAHARLIANHFGTEHVELDAADSDIDLLPLLARQFDEPIADSSMIPTYLVSRLTREHCTVALGGDGGDELFGGYIHYSQLLKLKGMFGRIPRALRLPIAQAAGMLLPIGFRGRNWLQDRGVDLKVSLPSSTTYFDRHVRRKLMKRDDQWPLVAEDIQFLSMPKEMDLLQRATRCDFENYLVEDILAKVDRASMLASLEIRAPMLDYRLIEFAFARVPSSLKATVTDRKIILKKLATRVLPPEFNQQRKQGFSVPLASWLRCSPWREFFREVLSQSDNCIVNRKMAVGILDGQAKGRTNSERLFALVMLELWRKEYRVSM
jgi:asparagine synthase (glutamine-hydrolysing)